MRQRGRRWRLRRRGSGRGEVKTTIKGRHTGGRINDDDNDSSPPRE